jgi:single-strand DNA-binding protein
LFQKYIAVGRTTTDLRLNFTSGGTPVANFDLAINRANSNKADYIPCVVWEEKAKEYKDKIGKGSLILVEGELKTYSHEKTEGEKENFLQLEIYKCKYIDLKPVAKENDVEN